MAGREVDEYDEKLVKFYTGTRNSMTAVKENNDRGEEEAKTMTSPGRWRPVSTAMNTFKVVPPLLDNSNTPRSLAKKIALERTKEKKKKWMPNSQTLNNFNPFR